MECHVASGGGPHHRPPIAHVAKDELYAIMRCHIGVAAGGEIIEYSNRVAICQQRLNQVRANEPSASGDENGVTKRSVVHMPLIPMTTALHHSGLS
jgi:hypothetical protein